jgi:hypothetical protein
MGIEVLKYNTELEANELIGQINLCLNLPTADGLTLTWGYPIKYCSDSGATEWGYSVLIKDDCMDCLTDAQKREILILPEDLNIC